jgi:hypothetical protein
VIAAKPLFCGLNWIELRITSGAQKAITTQKWVTTPTKEVAPISGGDG